MDVWIAVLGFVLFLGFAIADMVCVSAIKRKNQLIIKSRLHHKLNNVEVIYANVGLIAVVALIYFRYFVFVPAIIALVLFVVLGTRIESGVTNEGALIGTTFLDWEFMKGYKLVNYEDDSNVIMLKIRANHKQYVLLCERSDREKIREIFNENGVKITEVSG